MKKSLNFSLFPQGYRNQKGVAVLATKPQKAVDIKWVFDYITSERAHHATETLRVMEGKATKEELSDFKKLNFATVTPSGMFRLALGQRREGHRRDSEVGSER